MGSSSGSLAPTGPRNHTLYHLPHKVCFGQMFANRWPFSFLLAQGAFLELALKAREEGLWVQMTKGLDGIVMTAVWMLGEVAVRRTPLAGHNACILIDVHTEQLSPLGPGAGVRDLVNGLILSLCCCGLGMILPASGLFPPLIMKELTRALPSLTDRGSKRWVGSGPCH